MTAPHTHTFWAPPLAFPQLCGYLAERAPQPFAAVEGLTHIIRYVNPAFCRLVGQPASALMDRRFADAVPEGLENGCAALLDRAFDTGTHEVIAEQPHGTLPGVFWSYSAWAILGPDGDPVGVAVQVTDSSEIAAFRSRLTDVNQALLVSSLEQHEAAAHLAAELQTAERLAAIGTLAAGLGHDIGNLLLPIRMRLSALEHDLLPAHSDDLAALRAPLDYLQRLTNSLKLLALDPTTLASPDERTDLAEWWPDIRPMMRVALPAGIDLDDDLPAAPGILPPVAIAPAALSQVLYNLVQNAGEAIAGAGDLPPRGRIRISAALAPPPRPSATGDQPTGDPVRAEKPPDPPQILLTVADDGPGMTPEVLRRCMNPFFSTKARRISTGMGLSLVRAIIRKAGGDVRIQSELGRGTTFTISLPAAASPHTSPSDAAAGRTCRVAVTVSSPQVRAFLISLLAKLGADAAAHEEPAPPDADLWITEPRDELVRHIHSFVLHAGPPHEAHHEPPHAPPHEPAPKRRQLLIYGEPLDSPASMHATGRAPAIDLLRRLVEASVRRSPRTGAPRT